MRGTHWSFFQLFLSSNSRFIRLNVRLIHFDLVAAHPGNFEVVLSSSSRVCSLISQIKDCVGIQTSRLEVFRSRVPTEEACLLPESTLEECGFKGGPEGSPPEATVYYDYSLPFTDCPVLNCDHYFRLKPDSAAARRNAVFKWHNCLLDSLLLCSSGLQLVTTSLSEVMCLFFSHHVSAFEWSWTPSRNIGLQPNHKDTTMNNQEYLKLLKMIYVRKLQGASHSAPCGLFSLELQTQGCNLSQTAQIFTQTWSSVF